MALPYLLTLNARARFAYPIIQRGVRSGLSSRAIAESLQAADLGIRRATLLDIMRRERELVTHSQNLRFLPLDRAPNPDRLPEALTRLRRQYSYKIELSGQIIDTAELITRSVTVSTSKLLTRRAVEAIAVGYVIEDPTTYPIEVIKAQLVSVTKAGPSGTLL